MQFSASSLIAAATLISSAAAEFTLTINTLGVSTVLVGPTTVVTNIGGMAVTTALTDVAAAQAAIQLAIQLQAAAGAGAGAATTTSSSSAAASTTSAAAAVQEASSSATVEIHSTNAANKLGMASALVGGLSMLYILA